ncbi:MAG TPA: ABC-F family ATP-binding cassette domain-containing protein [Nocardioides sp.]|uniref:ABC-F family ATP-binding cassette domain-containing protein n=1 Tax=Nocardioides sp. TaxID=35761 RepID=UPI002D80FD76|nr:ABC-F family ATP-binding cassette domain-containing protein [Nocardioides sp.]HET6651105.1 ABC-F family ATP-binding cassette domain-containing protein [Nocardioides sp.]
MPAPTLLRAESLVARDLAKSYGDRVVLDGVDVVASPGQPLGMVGENGAGKSTLLRLLAGAEPADAGTVSRPAELAYLAQEPTFPPDATVAEVLDEALRPLHDAVARLEVLAGQLDAPAAAEEYAVLLDWCGLRDAWSADSRAASAAARLGVGDIDPTTPVDALSGGQRSRLALAALVAGRPPCVLLDEPTNHLDDDAVALLEEFLTDLPGVAVVATHDRGFLEAVCRQVQDLDASHFGTDGVGGSRFSGGYSDYLAAKRQARLRWEEAFDARRDELNRLRAATTTTARRVAHNRPPRDGDKFIHHFKGENVARTVSRRVRDLEQRIEDLESERIPKPPRELAFAGLPHLPVRSGRVVQVRDLTVAGRVEVPRLDLDAGEHLLVTGANGSGKSTLLKVLAGVLPATSGRVDVGARQVGYLPQQVTFRRPDRSAIQLYDGLTGDLSGATRPDLHGLGLLHPRDLHRPVGVLSLGQQRRLALAVLVAQAPDLLLLDEPTNHISLTLAEELEEALQRSPGGVVVASHDRWLRRRWTGSRLPL